MCVRDYNYWCLKEDIEIMGVIGTGYLREERPSDSMDDANPAAVRNFAHRSSTCGISTL